MLRCSLCASSFGTASHLFRHLQLIHGMYPGKHLRLKWGQTGCCLQFSSYSGFRRHVIEIHANSDNVSVMDVSPFNHETPEHDDSQCLRDETPCSSSQQNKIEMDPSMSSSSKDMCASLIAKLLGSGVPSTVVLSTIENLEELVCQMKSNIQNQVFNLLPADNLCRPAVEEFFQSIDKPFSQ